MCSEADARELEELPKGPQATTCVLGDHSEPASEAKGSYPGELEDRVDEALEALPFKPRVPVERDGEEPATCSAS